ncbi:MULTISPECIES: site-specific integrase [Pseudomonas]|uniref:site-specific integrase n=1 Tax=Pseudomonas TaxID=286 RepID=UPI0005A89B0E|nr:MULTISPECIES: tyrosine-type recombinase/integrase [Pseudomonas]AZD91073.1 phage-related integrase [Pseudomonas chlororaphis subsp. aureofaciens]KAB0530117.1 tyrosine-type recombinase/integrase [Pseudomonas chlororaphis subsp. aureofaciens]TSD31444.1 tyrosine-type recombinase/integrase [Pseudomonas sp. ATCC 13985]WDG62067.1 tyrosine-type recombinase/integrase [Pseudomonas chlororaphis]WDG68277.1 tyrosine-type recombinase/integrase [Pseudomonas chlororaphis]
MAKRIRLTEMEAYNVKGKKSEPIGSRGKGTLTLERKTAGFINGYYRERTNAGDKRIALGTLAKNPRPDTSEMDLDTMRLAALRMATASIAAGGLEKYLQQESAQKAAAAAELERVAAQAALEARRGTFGDLLDTYVEHLEKAGKVSHRAVANQFKAHIKDYHPELILRPAALIEPEDIQFILSGVLGRKPKGRGVGNHAAGGASNDMRSICNNLRLSLQAAFSHAVKAHLSPERIAHSGKVFAIQANPVRDVPAVHGAKRANTESLTPTELGELLRYLDKLPEPKRAITNALIYFGGQRMTQLCAVPWTAVTDDTICLLDAKGRKEQAWEHLLPITERISEILTPLVEHRIGAGPFAFSEDSTASTSTIIKTFSEAGRELATSGKTRTFTYRNVRVTAETLMAHQGISSEIRAWLLSHGRSGVQSKHYDRYAYLPEKRAALERWGRYLDTLAKGDSSSSNVVLLTRHKKSDER